MTLNTLPFSHLDNNEFTAVIYELRNATVHFCPERLPNLSIDLFTCDSELFLVRSDDLDTDIHCNIDGGCSYYVKDKFNDTLQSISREQSNHLSLFQILKPGAMNIDTTRQGIKAEKF